MVDRCTNLHLIVKGQPFQHRFLCNMIGSVLQWCSFLERVTCTSNSGDSNSTHPKKVTWICSLQKRTQLPQGENKLGSYVIRKFSHLCRELPNIPKMLEEKSKKHGVGVSLSVCLVLSPWTLTFKQKNITWNSTVSWHWVFHLSWIKP